MLSAHRKLFAGLVIALLAAACAMPFHSEDSLRPMSAQRIAALLVGNFLSNGVEGLGPPNAVELFCEGGRWARFLGQHVDRGEYSIARNSVCVMREGRHAWCREFFNGADGQVYVRDGVSVGLRPVAIEQGPPDPTCTSGEEP